MPGFSGGFEDAAALVQRCDPFELALVRARVGAQSRRAAPVVLPFVIKVDDQPAATVSVLDQRTVEVDVCVQILAGRVAVYAATEIPTVIQQNVDAGDSPDGIEKPRVWIASSTTHGPAPSRGFPPPWICCQDHIVGMAVAIDEDFLVADRFTLRTICGCAPGKKRVRRVPCWPDRIDGCHQAKSRPSGPSRNDQEYVSGPLR